jgi:NADH-quinone oxidoreductase subunit N
MTFDALTAAQRTLTVLLPELVILATAIVMMTAGAFVRAPRKTWSLISAAALVAALVLLIMLRSYGTDAIAYTSVALNDALSYYARIGLLLAGFIVLALCHDQVDDARSAEFFGALLLIQAGSLLVATANELVYLFAGLELVSLPTYLLLYLPRRTATTQEAATKYFYLSIFSSGILLFGMAYLYGLTGASNFKALAFVLHALPTGPPLAFGLIAVLFIMGGLSFRVAAVPFHFYAPDVYQGSPTALAALLAWVPKAVGFLAMIRVLTAVLAGTSPLAGKALLLAWVIAVATMTLGNTVALIQNDLKRLLAYSSIAHAGYLMIGVAASFVTASEAAPALGTQGVLFYLAAYALMTLGVFGAVLMLDSPERPVESVDDLAGLNRTHPLAALGLALCLFSLAGVPPLAGFWGKFAVFASALSVAEGDQTRLFQILTVLGVINAAIGAYYYLRIVVVMYLRPALGPPAAPRRAWPTTAAFAACAALSLLLGFLPGPINDAAKESALAAVALPEPAPTATAPQTAAR